MRCAICGDPAGEQACESMDCREPLAIGPAGSRPSAAATLALLALERQDCEVRTHPECEVFTRTVKVRGLNACPTCASMVAP